MAAHNLPTFPTPLIGRDDEIVELGQLLNNPNCRLLTLVGPGGVGKTRLAVEVASRIGDSFANGILLVPFATWSDPANMPLAIAQHTGYPFQPEEPDLKDQLLHYLGNKSLLLLLDNCEHLLAGCELVADILLAAPEVKVLATSREILNLQAERVFRVAGLDVPVRDDETRPERYSAIQLFAERARRVRHDFSIAEHAGAVTRICQLVEGMPLALVLAAAWVEALSPEAIADEIGRSVNFLAAEMRDLPMRHRSIRAVFDPTWVRLSGAEQTTFMKFAAFRGGCTRAAAQAVTGATLGQLQTLVNRALLTRVAEDRYEIHELLRQYAQAKLDESGGGDRTRDAHMQYYAEALHERTEAIDLGHRQLETLTAIEGDFENVRAAWTRALEQEHYATLDLMVGPLHRFYNLRKHFRDVLLWFDAAIEQVEFSTDPLLRQLFGRLLIRRSHHADGISKFTELVAQRRTALAIAREYGDQFEIAFSLLVLSFVTEDTEEQLRLIEESLAISRDIGFKRNEADCLWAMGNLLVRRLNRPEEGWDNLQQSLALYRELESKTGVAAVLMYLGLHALYALGSDRLDEAVLMYLGLDALHAPGSDRLDQAEAYLLESFDHYHEVRVSGYNIEVLQALSSVAYLCENFDKSRLYAQEMLTHIERYNMIPGYYHTDGLWLLGELALQGGEYAEGCRLLTEALESTEVVATPPARIGTIRMRLGETLIGLGKAEAGTAHIIAALGLIPLTSPGWIADCLGGISLVLAQRGLSVRALEIASLVVNSDCSPPWLAQKHPLIREMLNELHDSLSPENFDSAWERGKALDLATTVRELKTEFGFDPDDSQSENAAIQAANQALIEPLTPRELEILLLIGSGYTNRQIAEQLVVVEDTVKKHITHIYGKLGVVNRAQAIIRAGELKLLA